MRQHSDTVCEFQTVIIPVCLLRKCTKMNWMTSAKNRFQRSKNKRSDNLRLIASSKLPAFQQSGHSNGYGQRKSSVIVHNSSVNEQRKDKISLPMHNTTQSSDGEYSSHERSVKSTDIIYQHNSWCSFHAQQSIASTSA